MNTTTTKQRRDLMVERGFLPLSVDDLTQLRQLVLELGHPEQVANALCGWLVGKREGPDGLAPDTRSRYRRILEQVAAMTGPDGAPIMPALSGYVESVAVA